MARSPNALSAVDTSTEGQVEGSIEGATDADSKKAKRDLGPKVVYIQLKEGTPKDTILSVHTNTRTLVDSMESNPGSTYVKHTLPQGEPRNKRS